MAANGQKLFNIQEVRAPGGKLLLSSAGALSIWKGNTWYVDPTAGDDSLNGKGWNSAFASIGKANTVAAAGDRIYLAPGAYDETVAITKSLYIEGVGGRGACYIEPSTAGAEGMQVTADDVTLVNVGVAGDSTASYSLNVNDASRFRAYGCKFEGPTAVNVLLNGTATGQVSDALFYDCEFAWCGSGIVADDSVYGYVTQVRIEKCWFHNYTTVGVGVASGGLWKNLDLIDCAFDNQEDGTAPTDYILLSDNNNTGLITGCRFATATNATGVLTIGTGLKWVANATEAGWSTARPA